MNGIQKPNNCSMKYLHFVGLFQSARVNIDSKNMKIIQMERRQEDT